MPSGLSARTPSHIRSRAVIPDSRPRLAARSARHFNPEPQRIIEARASAVSLGNKGRTDLSLGQRVFHGKFGYGTIAAIEGNKLEIDFEHAGRKKVLDSFVSAGLTLRACCVHLISNRQ